MAELKQRYENAKAQACITPFPKETTDDVFNAAIRLCEQQAASVAQTSKALDWARNEVLRLDEQLKQQAAELTKFEEQLDMHVEVAKLDAQKLEEQAAESVRCDELLRKAADVLDEQVAELQRLTLALEGYGKHPAECNTPDGEGACVSHMAYEELNLKFKQQTAALAQLREWQRVEQERQSQHAYDVMVPMDEYEKLKQQATMIDALQDLRETEVECLKVRLEEQAAAMGRMQMTMEQISLYAFRGAEYHKLDGDEPNVAAYEGFARIDAAIKSAARGDKS